MSFQSLYYPLFLGIALIMYYVMPRKMQPYITLSISIIFAVMLGFQTALCLLLLNLVFFGGALILPAQHSKRQKNIICLFTLALGISPLLLFKYSAFWFPDASPFRKIAPIGISFYTFQLTSYFIDVMKGRKPENNILTFLNFGMFFPQITAGPINRADMLIPQLKKEHSFCFEDMRTGISMIVLGYFEKLVVADRATLYVDAVYRNWFNVSGAQILLAAIIYSIQIYADFSGYSLIALGSARLMGIRLMDNFRQPYLACTIHDFWKRWHISLTSWFRDYIYIPLGGSHRGKFRQYCNVMIVFFISGLWHGSSLSFIVWGISNGMLQIIENIFHIQKSGRKSVAFFQRMVTFLCITITWVFFRATSLSNALQMLYRIPTKFLIPPFSTGFSQIDGFLLLFAILLLLWIDASHEKNIQLFDRLNSYPLMVRGFCTLVCILFILVFGIWGQSYSAQSFIYFQF